MSEITLPASAQRVQDALRAQGFSSQVQELSSSTRTAKEAAESIGCEVAQIVKSLVFKTRQTQQPILVVASGVNRINEKLLGELIGEAIGKADADFVRQHTGFSIGGVAPIGHPEPLRIFIDEDLLLFETIWAAAGTPFSVFELTPAELQKMTGGTVAHVKA